MKLSTPGAGDTKALLGKLSVANKNRMDANAANSMWESLRDAIHKIFALKSSSLSFRIGTVYLTLTKLGLSVNSYLKLSLPLYMCLILQDFFRSDQNLKSLISTQNTRVYFYISVFF